MLTATGVTGILNTMLKSKPRGMILTPEREYITETTGYTHHTHGRHMMQLFVSHDAYEPMRIENF